MKTRPAGGGSKNYQAKSLPKSLQCVNEATFGAWRAFGTTRDSLQDGLESVKKTLQVAGVGTGVSTGSGAHPSPSVTSRQLATAIRTPIRKCRIDDGPSNEAAGDAD